MNLEQGEAGLELFSPPSRHLKHHRDTNPADYSTCARSRLCGVERCQMRTQDVFYFLQSLMRVRKVLQVRDAKHPHSAARAAFNCK